MSASIDDAGTLGGGTLSVGGTIASLGFNSGTLLTGSLTALGSDAATGVIDFLFSVTGGDAAGLFGSIGAVTLGSTGFSGSFAADFNNNGDGTADVRRVPEPAALWLFGAGLLGLFAFGRRRRMPAVA